MNFKTILVPKVILEFFCHKKATLMLHSELKCALVYKKLSILKDFETLLKLKLTSIFQRIRRQRSHC